jgi:hypothetical protein
MNRKVLLAGAAMLGHIAPQAAYAQSNPDPVIRRRWRIRLNNRAFLALRPSSKSL